MKRMLWIWFLVLGLILSWTPVYAGDSNVIPVVKTGQTKSYRTHDDGDLKKGVAWPTAALYDGCTNCFGTEGDCGLSDGSKAGDWRLPNRNELLSLIDIAFYNPALSNAAGTGQWSRGNPFMSVEFVKYWSSSTNASRPGTAGRLGLAWTVDFGKGGVGQHGKTSENYVWCVRDGN